MSSLKSLPLKTLVRARVDLCYTRLSMLMSVHLATCKIAIKGAGKAKYNADAGGIVWKYVIYIDR